jgi:hypothetical protein
LAGRSFALISRNLDRTDIKTLVGVFMISRSGVHSGNAARRIQVLNDSLPSGAFYGVANLPELPQL